MCSHSSLGWFLRARSLPHTHTHHPVETALTEPARHVWKGERHAKGKETEKKRKEKKQSKCPPRNNCPINCLSMNTVIVHIREIIWLIAQELAEPEKINQPKHNVSSICHLFVSRQQISLHFSKELISLELNHHWKTTSATPKASHSFLLYLKG